MHTIQIELDDNLYNKMRKSGIDIKQKFKEFLHENVDDGYPSISEDEAKQRVREAVESYRNGTMKTVSHDEVWAKIESYIEDKSGHSL